MKGYAMPRRFPKVPKDKKTGLPKKYLAGSKNPTAAAKEMKRTAKLYKAGKKIDLKAVNKFRANDKKTKRKNKKRT